MAHDADAPRHRDAAAFVAIGAIFVVYGATELVGGYGFLAVFAAGVGFRRHERGHEVNQRLHDVTLVIEKLGELSVLLLLGSVLPIDGALELGWPAIVVALGLLLVVRPLAVLVALVASGLAARQRLFVARFGIRGIGSIYYLGFAFAALTPVDARPLFSVTAITIVISVLAHGLTSGPLTGMLIVADRREAASNEA
ncbi:MAG: cation:proton antiporter [Candidatus Limnocylindria bacterium]